MKNSIAIRSWYHFILISQQDDLYRKNFVNEIILRFALLTVQNNLNGKSICGFLLHRISIINTVLMREKEPNIQLYK